MGSELLGRMSFVLICGALSAAAPVPPDEAHFVTIGEACSSTRSDGILIAWRIWTTTGTPCANAKLPAQLKVSPDRVTVKVGASLDFRSFGVSAHDENGSLIPRNAMTLEMQEVENPYLDLDPYKAAEGGAIALRPGTFYLRFASAAVHHKTGMQVFAPIEVTVTK